VTTEADGRPPVISVMLAVPDAGAAAAWYAEALGATEMWNLGSVIGLDVAGAPLFLGEPEGNGWSDPAAAGTRTVRIEVFVDDPDAFVARAVAAGADASRDPIRDHRAPWGTHRQGAFVDPFGHLWLVGDRSPLSPHPAHDDLVRRLTEHYTAGLPVGWILQPGGPVDVHMMSVGIGAHAGAGRVKGEVYVYGPPAMFTDTGALDPHRLLAEGATYVFAGLFPAGSGEMVARSSASYAAHLRTIVTGGEDVVFGGSAAVGEGVVAALVAAITG
jgi:uncharacterized glyoxalase superfamily protein PhnB